MQQPRSERSDWTDQDLLTVAEALPRVAQAIAEVEAELAVETDPAGRTELLRRLAAMRAWGTSRG